MINEEAVKQFFLETNRWVIKENPTPIMHTHFPHSRALLHNNGRLYYIDVWSEAEEKNTVQSIGHILIWHQPGPLWGMNYDGWYERDKKIRALEKELLIKTLLDDESFGRRKISGDAEDKRLLYDIETDGRFQLFEIKTLIVPSNQRFNISRFTYRGRALINLNS